METVFRKEIKYLISRREAMILQQKLDGIMERDIHGDNGRYFIRSQYALIVIGSAFLLLFLIITRKGFTSCNKLLVVQGKPDCLHKTEAAVDTFFSGKAHVSMRNVTEGSFELVYSIGEGILYKAAKENQMDISEKLIKIDGVKRVNIVDQKDELSQ